MYYVAQLKEIDLCNGCGSCIRMCPEANAINIVNSDGKKKKVEVDVLRCKGCAICAELCPKKTLEMVLR
jgi:Pyruvate/2-oxoacid:ferredoxin oxidoreductase delta subunit